MTVPEIIQQLVERFEKNRLVYISSGYKEARLRGDFLDPFFESLGWDVHNKKNNPEDYREVIIEDALRLGAASAAPDYAFMIEGRRKFYAEAKKPSANIETGAGYASQLRSYSWSSKLPLGLLTDFEEFAVYDTRGLPTVNDRAATGRIKLLSFTDYLHRWDEIAQVFSREAVFYGSFDQFAQGIKKGKGTIEVDEAFLKDIEGWRDLLARNIALRNPDLGVPELNYAVQMTIDRIIFLRICEDRGIERDDQLKELLEGGEVYARLCQLFQQADSRYNSGLFHFTKESGRIGQDDLTPRMAVDDRSLKEIIKGLYAPAPYIFQVIPADILGQVYERFLGKVIRLTAGHQAKVEEKPEVRKAGGVYYTPTYIVEYIVKNTVGKLLEDKTLRQVGALKILDPACGSGSFLLGAYQYLLDWHTKWYSGHDPEKWAKEKEHPIYPAQGGGWKLTTAEKKRILLNNIHGVDIDAQAVEVTKLSLLLKVLEGESQESIGTQMSLFKERALPDLGRNIQCGNSLIGPDYFEGRMLVEDEERRRVNTFDWGRAFPLVFSVGGFDAVIGNPPYLKIEHIGEGDRDYFSKKYKTFIKRYDTFGLFVEKSQSLLKASGLLGMIIPSTMLNNLSFRELRKSLLNKTFIREIVNLGGNVFEGVNNDTLIFIYENHKVEGVKTKIFDVLVYGERLETAILTGEKDIANTASAPNFVFELRVSPDIEKIFRKMKTGKTLGDICSCFQGFVTGSNEAYIVDAETIKEENLELSLCNPAVFGDEVGRYARPRPKTFVIYLTRDLRLSDYPNIQKRLEPFKEKLDTKREVKLGRQPWYSLHWPRVQSNFDRTPKLLVQAIRNLSLKRRVIASLDEQGLYADHTLFVIYTDQQEYEIKFLLGILNSNLINFLFAKKYIDINIKGIYLLEVPIPNLIFSNPGDKAQHDRMVSLVERMLALHSQKTGAGKRTGCTPQEQERLQREIESTDAQIDRLVYELYGLTEEEIKIVEGG